MNRLFAIVAIAATALITVGLATAAAPSGNKITCFDDCVQNSPNKATFGQGGVYIVNQPGNQLVGDVSKLSFNYTGTGAVPGEPRFSIPINTSGTVNTHPGNTFGYDTDFFVFADVVTCNNGSTTSGVLDVTGDPTCPITTPSGTYANWAAFVAANPTAHIAGEDYTFIISDGGSAASYTVFNVQILNKSRGGK